MPTALWRTLAITCASIALLFALTDAFDWQQYNDDHLNLGARSADGSYLVVSVTAAPSRVGGIQAGDTVTPEGGRLSLRAKMSALPAGTIEHWTVRRAGRTFRAETIVQPPDVRDMLYSSAFNVMRVLMIAIAILVAARRPDAAEARALVVFLVAFAYALFPVSAWLPDRLLPFFSVLQGPILVIGLGYGAYFACIFPAPSAGGLRAWLERIMRPLTFAFAGLVFALVAEDVRAPGHSIVPPPLAVLIQNVPFYLIAAAAVAFGLGVWQARGLDRQRARWAAGSLALGFFGPLFSTIVRLWFGVYPDWVHWSELTVIAIPIGLAYTILRHRTIDIGFVISRALVLTTLSFIVIAAFGLLERALGKLFIDQSHIASRTVEIALALGLGFSLRTLHARIERGVDFLFFRERQRAIAALRAFAADVFYITDPAIVVERTIAVIETRLDAAAVTLVEGAALAGNDPLFVRLRSSRGAVRVRECGSIIAGELAFPMVVRGELTGALIVAAKRNGETYDPEERTLLAEITERVGFALDALRTLAIREELEALRAATGGVVAAF